MVKMFIRSFYRKTFVHLMEKSSDRLSRKCTGLPSNTPSREHEGVISPRAREATLTSSSCDCLAYQIECCKKSINYNLNSNRNSTMEVVIGGVRQGEETVTDVVSQGGY